MYTKKASYYWLGSESKPPKLRVREKLEGYR